MLSTRGAPWEPREPHCTPRALVSLLSRGRQRGAVSSSRLIRQTHVRSSVTCRGQQGKPAPRSAKGESATFFLYVGAQLVTS